MKKIALMIMAVVGTVLGATAQPEATYNYLDKTYTLNADGSVEMRVRSSLTYNTMSSFFSMFGETFIEYNPEFQTLTINDCYTRQVDGTIIKAPANAFNEVLPRSATDAPAYNHLKEMVITHTGLELGATAFLDYTITSSAEMMGGELDFTEIVPKYAAEVRKLTLTVKLPEGKTLRYAEVDALGKSAGIKSVKGSKTWTWNKVKPFSREQYAPALMGKARLYATTLPSTAEVVGRMYYDTRDMFRIDPVRTAGKEGADKVAAICGYVSNMMALNNIPAALTGYRHAPARTVDARCYGTELDKIFMLNKALLGEGFECDIMLCYPKDCPLYTLSGYTRAAVKVNVADKAMWLDANGSEISPAQDADRYVWVSMVEMAPEEVAHQSSKHDLSFEIKVSTNGTKGASVRTANGVRIISVNDRGSLNLAALNSTRTEPFELYNTIDHREVYTVTLEDGNFVGKSRKEAVNNSLGNASWEVSIDGNVATITRTLKINKSVVWPSEWKQMRELVTFSQNSAPLTLITK